MTYPVARPDSLLLAPIGLLATTHRFQFDSSPSPRGALQVKRSDCVMSAMSTTINAEASKPQKKMQQCNTCKAAGFAGQLIGFEKIGEDPQTGRTRWRLVDESGAEHVHKSAFVSRRKRIVDIVTLTDLSEVKKLLAMGWDYKTSYPATIASLPHYVLVKRE